MINLHTLNKLDEEVITVNILDDEEDLDYEIKDFFNKLMKRRRNDSVEEGLQAGGVIYPDRAGFKICERDGNASHAQAQEHVSQYLNGVDEYTSEEAIGFINQRKNDPNSWINISKNGFSVRIVASKEMLIFVFNTYRYDINEFQLNVISKIVNLIKESYYNKEIKYPYINFVTGKDRFIFRENDNIEDQLDNLEALLNKRFVEAKEKTR